MYLQEPSKNEIEITLFIGIVEQDFGNTTFRIRCRPEIKAQRGGVGGKVRRYCSTVG